MSHQNVNLTYPNLLTPPVQLFLDTSITNSAAVQEPETWWDLSSFPHYTALPILIHHQYLLTPQQIFLILLFFNSPVIQTTILFTQPNLFISIPSLIVPGNMNLILLKFKNTGIQFACIRTVLIATSKNSSLNGLSNVGMY